MTHTFSTASSQFAPVFTTDLFMPTYEEGRWHNWEIKKAKLSHDHGYYSGTWMAENLSVLVRHKPDQGPGAETWMSPSPHEIESQELGCRHAYGHMVVMGLGLGWVAVNAALNPRVDTVTVIEIDPDVIALINELELLAQIPEEAREKIDIIQADALKWRPRFPRDFLYADIWQKLGEACVLTQMQQMQENIQADQIYFWGQELTIYNEINAKSQGRPLLNEEIVTSCVQKEMGLPLIIPEGYAGMIQKVVDNRRKRRLPLKRG